MAGNWNPNEPGAIGLEWLPTMSTIADIRHGGWPAMQEVISTEAELITSLHMRVSSTNTNLPLFTVVDVMRRDDVYPGVAAVKSVQLPPSQDYDRGAWVTSGGGTSNLWTQINDPVTYPPSASDFIRQSTPGTSAYRCHVDDSEVPADARVCRLTISAVHAIQPQPVIAPQQFVYRLQYLPTGALYTPPGAVFMANIYGSLANINCGEVNPVTLRPWTRGDLAQFGPGGNWVVRVEAVAQANCFANLHSLALTVHYLAVENRVAVGTWARPVGAQPEWVQTQALMAMPAGTAGWAKPSAGRFVFYWRAANAPLLTQSGPYADDIRWLAGFQDLGVGQAAYDPAQNYGMALPPPGIESDRVQPDEYGVATRGFGTPYVDGVAYGLVLAKSGPAWSDDSQPYDPALLPVTSAQPVAQRVRHSSGGTRSYLGVRFIAIPPNTGSSTLTVTVHQVSGGAQVGGSASWTAAEVRAMPEPLRVNSWRLLERFLSTAAPLASGTQYEVRFTVTGAGQWVLMAPSAGAYASASYRSTLDSLYSGGIAHTFRDISAVLLVQPDPLTGLTADVRPWEAQRNVPCGPGDIDQVVVSWDPTSHAASFSRIEVDRLDQAGAWQRIFNVTDEATTSVLDMEAPRNRPSRYRARVVLTTGAFGPWVETGFVTPEQDGPGVVFTSNAAPELTVVLDHDPQVSFDFVGHAADEVYRPSGEDGQVVFFEPEDRGVAVRYRLTVNFGQVPHDEAGRPIGDLAVWEPLRRVTRATTIPYVAVLDGYGNVVYGHVTLIGGEREQPGNRYWCDADVLPTQMIPTAVEAP